MKGYYMETETGKGMRVPTGRLRIEVKDLPEFEDLLNQAKQEVDQLQNTINRLSNFELNIDFDINESISES